MAATSALPTTLEKDLKDASLGTEAVTFNILRSKYTGQENIVFAPFGYAAILSILGEGARGTTQKEIRDFLRLSDNAQLTRDSFRTMMARYGGDEPSKVPQFKTWFYVYRNNTVNEEFVKTLRDDYLVEVKTIDRNFYDFDVPSSSDQQKEEKVFADDEAKEFAIKESETKLGAITDDSDNEFDAVDLDGKNLPEAEIDAIIKQKECSRFDEEVDEKMYVEVDQLREQNAASAGPVASRPEDNETVQPIEKVDEKKVGKIDENAEKLKELDAQEEVGVLEVAKKHPVTKKFQATVVGRSLEEINDVSSALSGNSLMGPREDNSQEKQSKMLLFNGLYFRGKWKTPFQVRGYRLRSLCST